MRTLILDNYDSFTFNLYQEVGVLGGNPVVHRNDRISMDEIRTGGFTHFIISPGPGNPDTPKDIGISETLLAFAEEHGIPLLGVCLGHQIIGKYFGATVLRAREAVHGKSSSVLFLKDPTSSAEGGLRRAGRSRIFEGLPLVIDVMRYHSLCVRNLPSLLRATAMTTDDVLMGLEHRERPIFGVQFHPESIGTPCGRQILKNFLSVT